MDHTTEQLNQVIVGLMDLVREVKLHGKTARFDMRAPGLLLEATQVLQRSREDEAMMALHCE